MSLGGHRGAEGLRIAGSSRGSLPLLLSSRLSEHTTSMYASSSGYRADCYAEHAVSSPALAEIIATTHYAYNRRDGQAEWARVAWKIPG